MRALIKIGAAISVLFLSSALFSESIKDYVCIVRPVLTEADELYVSGLQDELKGRGYSRYSDAVDGWKKGSFGSGFLYIGKDSKPYIITNLHVVSHFSSAEVLFEDSETGEKKKYSNLSVVAVSDDVDVAVLSFSDKAGGFKKGLKFNTEKLEDGTEVWSAGFPGLGAEPLWQLGKGNVTNGNASIKELVDPSFSMVIQHSANVDCGNSGGPLLVVNNKESFKYQVAAVNTWKARYRDGTNFSIPSAAVKSFVDNAIDGKSLTADKKEKVVSKIAAALEEGDKENDFTLLMKYVSYECARKTSVTSFVDIMKYGSSNARNTVTACFAEDPYEGMRAVAASRILSNYQKQKEKIPLEYASKLKLVSESGVYRIAAENKAENDEKISAKPCRNSPVRYKGLRYGDKSFAFAGGYIKAMKASFKPENSAGYEDCQKNDGYFGEFRFVSEFIAVAAGVESMELGDCKKNAFNVGGMLLFPFDFNQFVLNPFLRGNAGTNFSAYKMGYEVGCEVLFGPEDWRVNPGFGISYNGALHSKSFDKYKVNSLKIYGTLYF